ncbi:MAG: hypothetical protein N3B10_07365, partial [Armatimonadetes bacterium]|nr:hypothetical protein [Armatimonadota bacterium]
TSSAPTRICERWWRQRFQEIHAQTFAHASSQCQLALQHQEGASTHERCECLFRRKVWEQPKLTAFELFWR